MSTALRIFEGRFGRVVLRESIAGHEVHSHSEHQLILKYDGADRKYRIGGEDALLTRNDILFLNAQRPHETLSNDPGCSSRMLVMNLVPDWLAQTFPSMFRGTEHSSPYPRTLDVVT